MPTNATVVPVTEPPPKVHDSAKKRGKQPKWEDLQVLGAVNAIINLPDASINGERQKREDWHTQLKCEYDRIGARMSNCHQSLTTQNEITNGILALVE